MLNGFNVEATRFIYTGPSKEERGKRKERNKKDYTTVQHYSTNREKWMFDLSTAMQWHLASILEREHSSRLNQLLNHID